jgi:hypothetical protein
LFRSGEWLADELGQAPNPKPTVADKARFGKLASLYTAFSCGFAAHALDICVRSGCNTIADPFAGMGTLAEVGRSFPINLLLGDISPFAALSSTFRSASRLEIDQSASELHGLSKRIEADDERAFFGQLLSGAVSDTQTTLSDVLRTPSSPDHRRIALTIYLAALSRIRLYKRSVGSNPTWVKRPQWLADRSSTLESIEITVAGAREFARQLPELHPQNNTSSVWSSIAAQAIVSESLDGIVTSPPYANRTDYIGHYLPASELLLAAAGVDERMVRSEQIGTPLIRNDEPTQPLPDCVCKVLHDIKNHASYASKRYYSKTFSYYFSDMFRALRTMHSWLRPGGILIMVAQDTYYKDLHIQTPALLIEMAGVIGFKLIGFQNWSVRKFLSQLSPHSRRIRSNRSLTETAIALNK